MTAIQAANRDRAAAYLQGHPGQRFRYEQVAAALGISNQQASIALCGLLNDHALPGLSRPGRGTYRWDAPGPGPAGEPDSGAGGTGS